MKNTLMLILTLASLQIWGKKNPTAEAQPIVAEGKQLYKMEMASWYGTDLFIENYRDKANIGGYFSYLDDNLAKCIFFSKADTPKVIGTISFDSTYNTNTANIDLTQRAFTSMEYDLYELRKITLKELTTNANDFFKFYENTNPNIIPIIEGQQKKVYILTGPQKDGIAIFGNDYLLTFGKNNNLVAKKQLHKNIIPIEYGETEEGGKIESAMHSHLPETGDFITATDICTLMLYQKFANWEKHTVVSKKYMNVWNCITNELTVIPMSTIEKINKHQEQQSQENDD